MCIRAGPNGVDIKVLRHHTVLVLDFQSIKVSTWLDSSFVMLFLDTMHTILYTETLNLYNLVLANTN